MESNTHYRAQAAHARRLADSLPHYDEAVRRLHQMAVEYDEIAVDLEIGAVEIRHPELLPQNKHR